MYRHKIWHSETIKINETLKPKIIKHEKHSKKKKCFYNLQTTGHLENKKKLCQLNEIPTGYVC